jgi:hypothetical protein
MIRGLADIPSNLSDASSLRSDRPDTTGIPPTLVALLPHKLLQVGRLDLNKTIQGAVEANRGLRLGILG